MAVGFGGMNNLMNNNMGSNVKIGGDDFNNKPGGNFEVRRRNRATNDLGSGIKVEVDEVKEAREALKLLRKKDPKPDENIMANLNRMGGGGSNHTNTINTTYTTSGINTNSNNNLINISSNPLGSNLNSNPLNSNPLSSNLNSNPLSSNLNSNPLGKKLYQSF